MNKKVIILFFSLSCHLLGLGAHHLEQFFLFERDSFDTLFGCFMDYGFSLDEAARVASEVLEKSDPVFEINASFLKEYDYRGTCTAMAFDF